MTTTYDRAYVLNVAATAQNLLDGTKLCGVENAWAKMQEAWENCGMGFIEFTLWIGELAMYSEDKLLERKPQEFPGVYDYEVSYEVGQLIAQYMMSNKRLPEEEVWKHWIDVASDAFFEQGGGPVYDPISEVWSG